MAIAETLLAQPPPLEWKENGQVLRIRGTRIPLDTVVYAYQHGETVRDILDAYDTLTEEAVYGVISFYLSNKPEVDAYMAQRGHKAAKIREAIEAFQPSGPTKGELLARMGRSAE